MKTFTFRYDPDATPKNLFAAVASAARGKMPHVERDELRSNSIEALLSAMTAGRIELFYAIVNQRPDSIYSLSQMLNRDPGNVTRDVKVLDGLGLVQLVPEKDGKRERMRPIAAYHRLVFDFGKGKTEGHRASSSNAATG